MKTKLRYAAALVLTAVMMFAVGITVSAQEDTLRKIFSAEFYLKANPDLRVLYGTDEEALYAHFINYGANEGRLMTPLFDVNRYKTEYPELVEKYGDDNLKYYHQYFTEGITQGRKSCGLFDAGEYANTYKDLQRTIGYDAVALYNHYMTRGVKEGRDKGLQFNAVCYATLNPEVSKEYGTNRFTLYNHYLNTGLEQGLKGAFTDVSYKYSYCEANLLEEPKHVIVKWVLLEDPTRTGVGYGYDQGTCEICGQTFKEKIFKINYRYEE